MSDGGRRGMTLLELLISIAITALLVAIMPPTIGRARELARGLAEKSAGFSEETEEMAAAREAAQKMSEELGIDGRAMAVVEAAGQTHVEATVLVDHPEGSGAPPDAKRRTVGVSCLSESDGAAAVSVSIDGTVVYTSVGGSVRKYLGAGEWEDALDRALWQIREAQEARFKRLREQRYGPLRPRGGDAAD